MRSRVLVALFAIGCVFASAQSAKGIVEPEKHRQTESYFVTLRRVSVSTNMVVLEIYTQDTRALRVEHFNAETNELIGTMQIGGSSKLNNGQMARHEYRGDIVGNRVKMDVKLPNGVTLRVSKTLGTGIEYINLQSPSIVHYPTPGGDEDPGGGGGCPAGQVTTTINTVACGRPINVSLCCTPPVVLVWDDSCNISCN